MRYNSLIEPNYMKTDGTVLHLTGLFETNKWDGTWIQRFQDLKGTAAERRRRFGPTPDHKRITGKLKMEVAVVRLRFLDRVYGRIGAGETYL